VSGPVSPRSEPHARPLRVGELFAGIGGFGLAAERAGCSVEWAVEIDPFASRVYERRFPRVRRFPDVRDFDGTPVDCITGGFPCQDVSVAGKRKGLIGERTGLFWEIIRIAQGLRPRWLLLENVPGLLSSHRGRDFETVLAALDELGYGVAWRVLDAQFFGVPQRRRRVFIVGHLGSPCPAEVLFEPESVSGDFAPGTEARAGITQSLTRSLGAGDADDNDAQGDLIVIEDVGRKMSGDGKVGAGVRTDGICYTHQAGTRHAVASVVSNGDAHSGFRKANGIVTHALSSEGADASEDGTGRGTPIVAAPLTSSFAKHHGASAGKDSYPHNIVAGTVRSHRRNNSNPTTEARKLVGGAHPRRLTPRECERLQGFPDDWTLVEGASDSARYRALGNAVAVPVVAWIFRRLCESRGAAPPADAQP